MLGAVISRGDGSLQTHMLDTPYTRTTFYANMVPPEANKTSPCLLRNLLPGLYICYCLTSTR